ncbi:phytanoyl-CoA dioxygenase family protein [Marinibacterium sp. SX1]|uniref:phytanoyl-CoA dioxygenase family protein n=1 Tax=Marinibacterium sp. SX1 TaxID=3388424 RepID=UPI003D16EC31
MPVTDSYENDGYVSPIAVMTPDEAAGHVEALRVQEAKFGGQLSTATNAKAHLLFPFLWDIVQDPRIVDHVERILGPDILCWGSSFFAKEPGSASVVPWHQDGTCWGLDAPRALTAWVALTPSTPENGCLRVVPGSHREWVRHAVRNASSSMLPLGEEVAAEVDEDEALLCPLQAGEMSMHHVMLVHGSAPNRATEGRRIGFAIRYIAGDVGQRNGHRGFATMVRGRDHGTYELEQKPEKVLAPEALRRHREILRRSAEIVTEEAGILNPAGR